ncbi:phasin family protein [Photobacterium sp. SDRW27]|uniref:phasin-related domain-containing protein n=1 Tax=Photobacterium obscurum TaxID=2829490 RepID=UPI002242D6F9|nr:hypothetical protein [Photobacterium obscurum]MCW8327677.1 phasin family protein [Photobacterium obscurum]
MINPAKVINNIKSVTDMGETSLKTAVWAGLGAYSKGIEQVGMAQHLAVKRFSGLVEKGQEVETETLKRFKTTQSAIVSRAESEFNRGLNMTCGIDRDRLTDFEAKVDRLQQAVEKLAKEHK